MTVTIRQMTAADLPAVAACQEAAFQHSYDPAIVAHEFAGCHRLNPDGLQVAEDDGEIVGTIWGAWNGRRAVLTALAVRPDHQGRGIARLLIEAVEQNFRAKGVSRMSLEVDEGNTRVIPMYEHLGFRVRPGLIRMDKNLNNLDGTSLDAESRRRRE